MLGLYLCMEVLPEKHAKKGFLLYIGTHDNNKQNQGQKNQNPLNINTNQFQEKIVWIVQV